MYVLLLVLNPILFALPVEFPEIGHEYVGGASGLAISLMNAGGFLVPLLVMTPLIGAGTSNAYTIGFVVIMVILAAVTIPIVFVMETGTGARTSQR